MPLSVKKIKELKEEDCFVLRRDDGLMMKVVSFLKDNNKDAYTPKEISKELIKLNLKTIYGEPIKNKSLYNVMLKIRKKSDRLSIKHKGNFYWYEE